MAKIIFPTVVFTGKKTTILGTPDRKLFVVKHGPNKVHSKTFRGDNAPNEAERMAWKLGDLTANV
jgi:hypothetical protein